MEGQAAVRPGWHAKNKQQLILILHHPSNTRSSKHQHGRYKLLNLHAWRRSRTRTRCAFQWFAVCVRIRVASICRCAKRQIMGTLHSCQNPPRNLTSCQGAPADGIGRLVPISVESPRLCNKWTPNRNTSQRQGQKVMDSSKISYFLSGTNAAYKRMVEVQQWPGLCTK